MVTPELLNYIRGELGKNRTREDICLELTKGGGWSEDDLSEAFRIILPMQGFFAPTTPGQFVPGGEAAATGALFKINWKYVITLLLVLAIALGGYFYRPQIAKFAKSALESMPSFDFSNMFSFLKSDEPKLSPQNVIPVPPGEPVNLTQIPAPITPVVLTTTDCGVAASPDLKDPKTLRTQALSCLGAAALSCHPAKAILTDAIFPTMVEISRPDSSLEVCDFRLAYPAESTLTDTTGAKLAGQSITCPVSAVKLVEENRETLVFKVPNKSDPAEYAREIYFYGTLGVFMEKNVDKAKILSLGCSGTYIDSVIASYRNRSR